MLALVVGSALASLELILRHCRKDPQSKLVVRIGVRVGQRVSLGLEVLRDVGADLPVAPEQRPVADGAPVLPSVDPRRQLLD